MSLRLWLPLRGDLNNQGLDKYTCTGTNVTVDNSGKIGKCYSFNGTSSMIKTTENLFLQGDPEFSVCFWVYANAWTNDYAAILEQDNNQAAKTMSITCYSGKMALDIWNYRYQMTTGVPAQQWHHVAVTKTPGALNTTTKIYIDGVLNTNCSGTADIPNFVQKPLIIGRLNAATNRWFNGKLNDVRIYDHALSAKEVEEISKGLVLHYKLNNIYINNNLNLMPDHLNMHLGTANASTGTWRLAGTSNMSRARVAISSSPEGPCYGFENSGTQTANDGSCYGIDSFPLNANTIYTVSMWARTINGQEGYAGYVLQNISEEIGGSHTKIDKGYRVTPLPNSGEWTYCWYTFKTGSNTTRNIYIGITTGTTSVTTQMCCVHIAKMNATLGNNLIYDVSGYSYIAESNAITWSGPSPRYDSAAHFDGNTSFIKVPFNDICPSNIFTMNLWFKKNALGTKNYETLFGGPSGFEMDTRSGSSATLSLYMASTRGGNVFSPFNLGEWYMVTMVRDGINELYYINGELKKTIEAKAMPTGIYRIGAWNSNTGQNYYGEISDFRIYVTPFTTAQIKELYNTSMAIDSNGNIMAREIQE